MTTAATVHPTRSKTADQSVPSSSGTTPAAVSGRHPIEAGYVAASSATTVTRGPVLRALRRRSGDAWKPDEVAAHLMDRQTQIVRGLARRSPWVGLDDETMDSCFGHAAAVVVKVAVSGQRSQWRTPKDLERAVVAAYRHQALAHWKCVNAQSRQGERFVVSFDPERHASEDAPIDRLFEQPDLFAIERDLLAEVVDEQGHAFWTIVLREHATFKQAGDRLGMTKANVALSTRAGRKLFNDYLERRASGELCRDRTLDILACRAGLIEAQRAERAEAHLECCYACALVHEPTTSAIQRGILSVAPTGLILRMLSRAGDVAATPVMRIADTGSGSRAVAAGLAAVAVGAGAGVDVVSRDDREPPARAKRPAVERRVAAPVAPPRFDPRPAAVQPAKLAKAVSRPAPRKATTKRSTPAASPKKAAAGPIPTPERRSYAVEAQEFSPEVAATAPQPPPPVPSPSATSNPAADEFGTP